MRFWTTDWSYNDFFNGLECSVNFAMKLSEKGFEQASERGFGRCSVPKSAHPDPREAPVRAPPGLFRQFLYGVLRSSANRYSRKSISKKLHGPGPIGPYTPLCGPTRL